MTTLTIAAVVTCMTDAERPYLSACLASLLKQSLPLGEIILLIEERNAWIDTIPEAADARVRVLRRPLAPLGAMRNVGVEAATCEWIAFCDGDDAWSVDKNAGAAATILATQADVVGTDHCLCTEYLIPCCYARARHIPMPSGWTVRRSLLREHPFDGTLRCIEDGEWWQRTAPVSRRRRCKQGMLWYRVRGGSLSDKVPSKRRKHLLVKLMGPWPVRLWTMPLSRLARWWWWHDRYDWVNFWGPLPPEPPVHVR